MGDRTVSDWKFERCLFCYKSAKGTPDFHKNWKFSEEKRAQRHARLIEFDVFEVLRSERFLVFGKARLTTRQPPFQALKLTENAPKARQILMVTEIF